MVRKAGGCWQWTGALSKTGYGVINIQNRTVKAHRFSWEIHRGEIPSGLVICHRCDNRRCVRPDHLFMGTVADNNRDGYRKGRIKKRMTAKLTDVIVRRLRLIPCTMARCRQLAARYGTHPNIIYRAMTRRTWRHV